MTGDDFELLIFLPQPAKCWKYESSFPAALYSFLRKITYDSNKEAYKSLFYISEKFKVQFKLFVVFSIWIDDQGEMIEIAILFQSRFC